MKQHFDLNRFINAQESIYATALQEIKSGRKRSHWMWFIFPQLKGLGISHTSQYYGICNIEEASAYLSHPLLGKRLIEICQALSATNINDAGSIFGNPDDLKLKSCLTLFSCVNNTNPIFEELLSKFFNGVKDNKTLQLLEH